MRVVIVSDYGEINGGAAKVAVTSARGLADAGIAVSFVCAIPPLSPLLNHPRIAVQGLGFESVWARNSAPAAAAQGVWNGRARSALDGILASFSRDETIVHFHQWTKALSPSVLDVPFGRGFPSVASLHDYFIACPNGAYYRFAQAAPCTLRPMSLACAAASCDRRSHLHKGVRVLRQLVTQKALARAGASLGVVSVSDFAERIVERFLPNQHPRFVVRSPVDAVHAPPVAVARNASFLFAGRLTEEKGVKPLAEIARDGSFPLTVAGDGPLLGELRAIGGTVRCTGWLDSRALLQTMNEARALIFPSTWYETGGLIVLEALARGIPAIVSRTTAAADFVVDGINGYVVDPGDWTTLAARMRSLTDDHVAWRMGAEAYRRYWSDPQTVDAHTGNLISVYRTMLAAAARDTDASGSQLAIGRPSA